MCPYRRRFHSFTHRPLNWTASKSHILGRAEPRSFRSNQRGISPLCSQSAAFLTALRFTSTCGSRQTGSVPRRCMWAQWLRLLGWVRACELRISIRLHENFCRDVEQPQWKEVICFVWFSFKSLISFVHSFLNMQCFAEVFHYLGLFNVLL